MKKFLICIFCAMFCGLARADTETINWYVGTSVYNTTNCESGGDIVLPTPPTKRGYTFNGWTSGIYDMSTLNTATNGIAYYAHCYGNSCRYLDTRTGMTSNAAIGCTNDNLLDLVLWQWKVVFSYGTVYGTSMCSNTSAPDGSIGNPATTNGNYCWCRLTGFIPSDNDILYEPTVSAWVYSGFKGQKYTSCAEPCAQNCGNYVRTNANLRTTFFQLSTN